MACPPDAQLQEFAEDRAPEPVRGELAEHVQGCAECARKVEEAIGSGPTHQPGRNGSKTGFAQESFVADGGMFGRYRVGMRLGSGAMGVVYAAHDTALDRKVALKILGKGIAGEAAEARFLKEARAMARLSHVNVVSVYDVGRTEGRLFISMELVEGVTLWQWLREKPRALPELLEIFGQAGRGLAAAHRASLVHRDFKPANVLIDAESRAKVGDFGLAWAAGAAEPPQPGEADAPPAPTRGTGLAGTPAYMAPEQLAGQLPSDRSDQFSFCVSLYEAVYGELPFKGKELAELWRAIRSGEVREPKRGAAPAWLRKAILRGLSADPDQRFASMDALLAELARGARSRGRLLRLAGLAACSCAALALFLRSGKPVPAPAPTAAPTPVPVAAPAPPPPPEPSPPKGAEKAEPPAHPSHRRATIRPAVATAKAPPVVAPASDAPGTLKIHVVPWGHIFVDGKPCPGGSTVHCALELPPGSHAIRVVNPYQSPAEVTRSELVTAGKAQSVQIDLRSSKP